MATSTKPKELLVLLDGSLAGTLAQDRNGQLSFTYAEEYRGRREPTPLSLSIRPTRAVHPHKVVDPFLRGLLPDSDIVLQRWASRFHVSANNPFGLLVHVGEDVAGAAQFILPDRLDDAVRTGALEPVDEAYIAERLSVLRTDRAAWNDKNWRGPFSLAGAQSKFALYYDPATGHWAIPSGRQATTHILKPALPGLAEQEINEHLCLAAAQLAGLDAARSRVMRFGDERAVVLERYDRVLVDGDVQRLHQEDMCQAYGIAPAYKYERKEPGDPGPAGPGLRQLVDKLREVQTGAAAQFSAEHYVKAVAYNWLIYAPDAHAKNYSILLDGLDAAPSPLYDISSVIPYPGQGEHEYDLRTMAMAMSVNRKYQNNLVTAADWTATATALKLAPDQVLGWVQDLAERVPDAFADAARRESTDVRETRVVRQLVDGVATHVAALRRNLYG